MNRATTFLGVFGIVGTMLAAATASGQTADLTADPSYTSTTFVDFNSQTQPGGLVTVSTTFHKPLTTFTAMTDFYSLSGNFTLPAGWTIDVAGLYDGNGFAGTVSPTATGVTAAPELDPNGLDFLYLGSFGNTLAKVNAARDFTITFSVHVPQGFTGQASIGVRWGYYWKPMPGKSYINPAAAVLLDNNPTPPQPPTITGIDGAGDDVVVQWSATNAGSYRVQGTPALLPVAWSNLPGMGPIPGASGTLSATDTNAGPQKFYRVLWTY